MNTLDDLVLIHKKIKDLMSDKFLNYHDTSLLLAIQSLLALVIKHIKNTYLVSSI